METSTIALLAAGWYGAGVLGCSVATVADWYLGCNTTLKDVLAMALWSLLGPVIGLIALGFAARTFFKRFPDRVLIEGRKRA